MKVYLRCQEDHFPPLDAAGAAGLRAAIAAGTCPICPEERLASDREDADPAWGWCDCCRSGWRLETEAGFACRPGRLVEEWE